MKLTNLGNNKRAFTLIEVMIALMILSIALLSFSQGQVVALNSVRRTRLTTLATIAAKNMMERIDLMYSIKGFNYIKELSDNEEGSFEDRLYKGWKWERQIKEVNIPLSKLINILMQQGGADSDPYDADWGAGESDFLGSGMEQQIISMVSDNVERLMRESIREVTVEVFWPVRGGREFSSMSIVYYVVDYESLGNFSPIM